jgi:hypothetical protein
VIAQPAAAPFSVFNTKRAAGDYPVWYGGTYGEAVDFILHDSGVAEPDERDRCVELRKVSQRHFRPDARKGGGH